MSTIAPHDAVWRKSSRSNTAPGNCVELAPIDKQVAVRDSKDPTGPTLAFGRRGMAAFARAARRGGYDR